MKHITIPLSDERWRTLKELATQRRLQGMKPDSITQIILSSLDLDMGYHRAELKAVRKAAKRKRP